MEIGNKSKQWSFVGGNPTQFIGFLFSMIFINERTRPLSIFKVLGGAAE
jgi:hypothetical protein